MNRKLKFITKHFPQHLIQDSFLRYGLNSNGSIFMNILTIWGTHKNLATV